MLLSLGSNSSGQLGIASYEDVNTPHIVQFSGSSILSKPGSLSFNDQLLNTSTTSLPPSTDNSFTRITAGGNHTLLITSSGNVYASGKLFPVDSLNCSSLPEKFSLTTKLPSNIPMNIFFRLNLPSKVVLCAATWQASFFVVEFTYPSIHHKIMVCGKGLHGELGLGPSIITTPFNTLEYIPNFPPPGTFIIDISGCISHVVVALSNGQVYGWGAGRHGQLGSCKLDAWYPRLITECTFAAKRVFCGKDFSLALGDPDSGLFFLTGSDKWGIISHAPTSIPSWKDVAVGWSSIHILSVTGRLSSWGKNNFGQLPCVNLPTLSKVCAGSEHVVALTINNQVIAWGWNEHGNCGPNNSNNSQNWSIVSIPHGNVSLIGAGCATTWVQTDLLNLPP